MPEALENTIATDRISLVSNQLRAADNEAQPTSHQATGKEHSMRIVLVHDDAIVRADIRELVSGMQGIELVGQYAHCDQALDLIKGLRPDVVVLDITGPGRRGLDALQSIRHRIPDVPVLVLTMQQAPHFALQLLRAGATGYLPKSAAITELQKAIRLVARGKYFWGEHAHEALLIINDEGLLHSLTSRQRQVLTLIAQGYNTKRIALALNIRIKTVESHRAQLMERLRIHDIAGLVRFAIRMGLVRAEER